MTHPTIPESLESCADWSHPLPHPDLSHIVASHFPEPDERRFCWECFAVWAVVTLVWAVVFGTLWLAGAR